MAHSSLFKFQIFSYQRYRSSQPGLIEEANVGTTAEIYECREPSSGTEVGYHIKAKGRQRFKGKNI